MSPVSPASQDRALGRSDVDQAHGMTGSAPVESDSSQTQPAKELAAPSEALAPQSAAIIRQAGGNRQFRNGLFPFSTPRLSLLGGARLPGRPRPGPVSRRQRLRSRIVGQPPPVITCRRESPSASSPSLRVQSLGRSDVPRVARSAQRSAERELTSSPLELSPLELSDEAPTAGDSSGARSRGDERDEWAERMTEIARRRPVRAAKPVCSDGSRECGVCPGQPLRTLCRLGLRGAGGARGDPLKGSAAGAAGRFRDGSGCQRQERGPRRPVRRRASLMLSNVRDHQHRHDDDDEDCPSDDQEDGRRLEGLGPRWLDGRHQ
jgi:hypothetical protein